MHMPYQYMPSAILVVDWLVSLYVRVFMYAAKLAEDDASTPET